MGITAEAKDAGAIADAVSKVMAILSALNPDRAVVLEVQNFTSQPLRLVSHEHVHGGFAETPSIEIPPDKVDVFGSKDTSVTHGTEGKVTYESDEGFLLIVEWNNPVTGGTSCNAEVRGSNSESFETVELCGAGDTANMQFSVRPGVTARPPDRKGSATADDAVSDIAVANNGARGVITAVRADNNTLKLISWEVASDGRSISNLGDSANQAGEASDIDIARGRLFVTACRAGNGNLMLISWEVRRNSEGTRDEIDRKGDSRDDDSLEDAAGEARGINILALSNDLFVTAVRTGSGNLKLITWRLEESGELTRLLPTTSSEGEAGAVSEISLVRVPADQDGNHRVVTAVRGGDGTLILISWKIALDGSSITRLSFGHEPTGRADLIRAVTTAGGHIVTAVRGDFPTMNLILISWTINDDGELARQTDFRDQEHGLISSNALMSRPTGVLSAVRSGSGGLKLIKWAVTPEGAIRRAHDAPDSGEQAGDASLITLCQEPLAAEAQICSVVRNAGGNLMLITWDD
jgi:hypothetical protein